MKLFAYKPDGHGEQSFFTIAENEPQAFTIIQKHIEKTLTDEDGFAYGAQGWGTDYYKLTIAEIGEVLENDNE